MKILQLNVWMGKVEGELQRFLEQNDYDIICMQEVMYSADRELQLSRMCFDLSRIIKAAKMPYSYYSPNFGIDFSGGTMEIGNVILSRIPITEKHSEFIHGHYVPNTMLGESPANNLNIQTVKLENGLTVVNHHGFWRPQPLGDEDTVEAFAKVGKLVGKLQGPLVLCGDLNITHEAPAMRNLDFLRDLTDEHKIKTTLSGLKFNGPVPCDHIMVNDRVQVNHFAVLDALASDHLPVEADIELSC